MTNIVSKDASGMNSIQDLTFDEIDAIAGADQWTYDAGHGLFSKVREGIAYVAEKAGDAVEYVGEKVSGLLE